MRATVFLLVALGAHLACSGTPEWVGHGDSGAGVDSGLQEDGGFSADAAVRPPGPYGRWKTHAFLAIPGEYENSPYPSALGANGAVSGTHGNDGALSDLKVFLSEPSTGYYEEWPYSIGAPYSIRAINSDGWHCGIGYWEEPQLGGYSGTAVWGRGAHAERMLPDPVSSTCLDMNESRATVGTWKGIGYFRTAEGHLTSFSFYPREGSDRFWTTNARALNEKNEVVGSLATGRPFGRGNPAALYWSSATGPILLENGIRGAVAFDINGHGEIVGAGYNHQSDRVATYWKSYRHPPFYLPSPKGIVSTQANSINDDGLIVGEGMDQSFVVYGIVWWNGKAYFADELAGGQVGGRVEAVYHVNNRGRLAGLLLEWPTSPEDKERRTMGPVLIDVLEYPE